jgi:hypothetical protein
VGAEIAATSFVQNRIEEQVRASTLDAGEVEVEIDSFPLVTSVLFGGRVDRVSLTMRDVDRKGVHFETLRLRLTGIEVNRAAVIRGEPGASSIRRGTLSARISGDVAAAAAELGEVPDGILPCDPVEVGGDASLLRLSCTMRPVPRAVLEEFGILG